MSWLFTRIDRLALIAAAIAMLAIAPGSDLARAANFETAVMPGKVIEGHAKAESECRNCHIRFDRTAQPRLCLDCHKEVAADVRAGAGFHGRLRERECRRCHTDHRGREARIVLLDEQQFDHAATDFALQGKHAVARCASCHRQGAKHRAAPSDCAACHRKDDAHKVRLGAACADCHNTTDWKDARFDHAKTRFPLLQRHARIKCAACHADQRFADAARDCLSCHRKDDAHKGRFGMRCANCHDAGDWKSPTFQHDRDTHFALRDRHRTVKCDACHRSVLYQAKTPTACQACHRKDDVHKGALGDKCESCHSEVRWKGSRFDHDRDSRFRLRGKHRDARCESCHKSGNFRDLTPTACVGCHRQDDRERGHKGRYGEACESCHAEDSWKATQFRHERDTRYPLRERHARVACDSCHRGSLYREKTSRDCLACHERDDKHKAQLGKQCERCHSERDWRETSFNHAQARFPLLGRHAAIACKQCHATPLFVDARTDCASCHAKRDDVHFGSLGAQCERCHVADDWRRIINREPGRPLPLRARPSGERAR